MTLERRLRVYLAEKAMTLEVPVAVPPSGAQRARRSPLRVAAVAAALALVVVGVPLFLWARLGSVAVDELPPVIENRPPALPAVELSWSTGTIPVDGGGTVVEVTDGWLFIPAEGGRRAWGSTDGVTWSEVEVPPPFSDGTHVFAVWSTGPVHLAVGVTGAGSDRRPGVWRSSDGLQWSRVDPFDPLPTRPHEFIAWKRTPFVGGRGNNLVVADMISSVIDFDAIVEAFDLGPGPFGHSTNLTVGSERVSVRSADTETILWTATMTELGFDEAMIARLRHRHPDDVVMWASDDGGASWRRGETLTVGPISGLVATDERLLMTTWPGEDDPAMAMRVSSDGARWRETNSSAGRFAVAASADRFLVDASEPALEVSAGGDVWYRHVHELVQEVSPNGFDIVGGRLGFLLTGHAIDETINTQFETFLFSTDGYTWLDTGLRAEVSPPDVGGVPAVIVGERSVAIVEHGAPGEIIVHVGIVES